MLAGCRFEFADLHDAAVPLDAPPQGLACNTPIRLGDGVGEDLSATATATRVLATWLDESGAIRAGGAVITAEGATAFLRAPMQDGVFTHVAVAAAVKADRVLGVATDATGTSFIGIADDATLTYGDLVQSTIALTGPHGVAATGLDDPAWVIAGNDSATMREQAAGIAYTQAVGPTLDCGNQSNRTTLVPLDGRVAVVDHVTGDDCDIKTMTSAVTSIALSTGWGTTGQCTAPTAVFSPGHTDLLLIRHDTTDNDLNHVIATLGSTGTVTIPGEMRLASPANEARGVGVTDGFWALYETAGALAAVHVDFAGAKGTPITLGMVPSAHRHDLVLFGGEPYAIWLGDGLELARLCQ